MIGTRILPDGSTNTGALHQMAETKRGAAARLLSDELKMVDLGYSRCLRCLALAPLSAVKRLQLSRLAISGIGDQERSANVALLSFGESTLSGSASVDARV